MYSRYVCLFLRIISRSIVILSLNAVTMSMKTYQSVKRPKMWRTRNWKGPQKVRGRTIKFLSFAVESVSFQEVKF